MRSPLLVRKQHALGNPLLLLPSVPVAMTVLTGTAGQQRGQTPANLRGSLDLRLFDKAVASKTDTQIARLGGATEVDKNLTRVVEELTSLGGLLR
jgi:hypothetical protein